MVLSERKDTRHTDTDHDTRLLEPRGAQYHPTAIADVLQEFQELQGLARGCNPPSKMGWRKDFCAPNRHTKNMGVSNCRDGFAQTGSMSRFECALLTHLAADKSRYSGVFGVLSNPRPIIRRVSRIAAAKTVQCQEAPTKD